jgi:hypothetical protein
VASDSGAARQRQLRQQRWRARHGLSIKGLLRSAVECDASECTWITGIQMEACRIPEFRRNHVLVLKFVAIDDRQ